MTPSALMPEDPNAGWHRKWLLLMVLLLWGFLCRFRLMGMLLARALSYQLRKKLPRMKLQVDIHHVVLSPLQFVHVEVRSDGDWRVLFTRITVKSNVRTFFRSFGQSKMMILTIDAATGTVERINEEFLREMVERKKGNKTKSAPASDETSKANPAAFLRFVDFRIGLIQMKMKCFGSESELYCRDFVVGVDEVPVNQNIYCLKVESSFILIRSSRSKSQEFNSDTQRDTIDDGMQLDLPDVSVVFDVTISSSDIIGVKWFGSSDSSCRMQICTTFIEWLTMKRAQLIRDGLIPFPKSSNTSSDKYETTISIEIIDIQLSIVIVHESANRGPIAMQLCMDIEMYRVIREKRGINNESTMCDNISLEFSDRVHEECMATNCHVLLRNISASGGRDFSLELFVLSFCEVQANQVECDQIVWKCHLGHMGVVMTPKVAEFVRSMAEAQSRIKNYIQDVKSMIVRQDPKDYDDKAAITQMPELSVKFDISVLVASWKFKVSFPSGNDSSEEMTAIGKQTAVAMIINPSNICLPTTQHVKVDEVNIDIQAQASHLNGIQSFAFIDLNLSVTHCASTQDSSSTKRVLVHFKSLSVNNPDNENSARYPVADFQDVHFERKETLEDGQLDINTSIVISSADLMWSHLEHKEVLSEWKKILGMLEKVESMARPTPDVSSYEPKTLSSNNNRKQSTAMSLRAGNTRLQFVKVRDVADGMTFLLVNSKSDYQKNGQLVMIDFTCDSLKAIWNELYSVLDISTLSFIQRNISDSQSPLAKVPVKNSISASELKIFLAPGFRLLLLFLRLDEIVNPKGENASINTNATPSRQVMTFICTKMYIAIHKDLESAKHQCCPIYDATMEALSLSMTISKSFKLSNTITRVMGCGIDSSIIPEQLSEQLKHAMEMEGVVAVSTISIRNYENLIAEILSVDIRLSLTQIQYLYKLSTNWPEIIFDWSSLATKCQIIVEENSLNHLMSTLLVIRESMDTREITELKHDANGNWRTRYVCNIDAAFAHWLIVIPYGHAYDSTGLMEAHIMIDRIALNVQQWRKMAVQYTSLQGVLKVGGRNAESGNSTSLPLQIIYFPQTTLTSTISWKKVDLSTVINEFDSYSLALELTMRGTLRSDPNATVPIQENALLLVDWDYVYPLLISIVTKAHDRVTVTESSPATEIQSQRIQCTGIQWDISLDAFQVSWWDGIMQDTAILVVFNDFLSHGILTSLPLATSSHPKTIGGDRLFLWETTMYSDLIRTYLVRESIPDNLRVQEISTRSTNETNFFLEMTGISYRFTNQEYSGDSEDMDDLIAAQFSKWDSVVICKLHEQFSPLEFDFTMCPYSQTKMAYLAAISSATLAGAYSESTPASRLSPKKTPKGWTQTVRNKLLRLKRRTTSMDNLLINDGSCPIQVDSMKLLWTIETRDYSFYVISVVVDSARLLIETKHQLQMDDVQPDSSANASNVHDPMTAAQTSADSIVHDGGNELKKKRQSARDSLFELLQQGKLGQNEPSLPDQEDTRKSECENGSTSKPRESVDRQSEKTIIFKKYTIDVHDAQINMHEENSGSSVLIASKHIHLECGLDEDQSNAITTLKFDLVTAHVAPIDVDITAGVLWYSYSSEAASSMSPRETSSSQSNSCLLKKILEECSLTTFSTLTLATGASSVEADLSFMQLSTDRHQFYQLLNVIRHVLLAPPATRRPTRTQTTHTNMQNDSALYTESSDINEFSPTSPSVHGSYSKKFHAQLADEIRTREARFCGNPSRSQMVALKRISFSVSGAQIRLRCSPEITGVDHEFVEIRVEEITGSHTYYVNQCTKLTLNMQWLEINNLRPGPSSIAFEDPTSVLRAKLLVGKHYKRRSRLDMTNQKGMLTIRAESGPLMRVLGQKLRVLDVLEVSIFPEISNQIVIQLASDFYDLLYKFFFERMPVQERTETDSECLLFGRKGVTSTAQTPSSTQCPISPMIRGRLAQPLGQVHPGSLSLHSRRKTLMINTSSYELSTNASSSGRSMVIGSPNASETGEEDDASTEGDELFYFKYVRIGNIRLGINCNGFFVNLNSFDLDLPPYVCQSKLATWKRLVQKFESHLKWHLTRETASSGLSHFKNKFLKWTPSGSFSDKKDKAKRDAEEEQNDEDSAAANAHVLFGPYSGSAT